MCDLKAYLKTKDSESLILEAVNQIIKDGNEVVLRNLFGEEKRVTGEVKEVSLTKSKVIVESA